MTQGYGQQPGGQDQWGQGGQNPGGQNPPNDPWGQPSPAPQSQGQDQWGQPSASQEPQWGQAPGSGSSAAPAASPAPQWGQPSPAGAPGGYPGSAGAAQYSGPQYGAAAQVSADGVNWSRVKFLGLLLLIGAALLLVIRLGVGIGQIVGADATATVNSGGTPGAVGMGSSVVVLLLAIGNLIVSLAMIVLGIMAAVMGRGRARAGGIIVAVAIPVAIVLYWVLIFGLVLVFFAGGSVDVDSGAMAASHYRTVYGIDLIRMIIMVAVIGFGAFMVHSTARKKLSA